MNESPRTTTAAPQDVLAFWRAAGPDKWFTKDAAFDDDIRPRFLATYEAAAAGALAWDDTAEGALALLIVLDQFPRNMFRGSARAFAADPLAREVATRAIARGFDQEVAPGARLLLPAVRAFRDARRPGALRRAQPRERRRRCAQMGRAARRHHPPFRPLPASQRRAWPRHHGRGAGLPRQRRLRGLSGVPAR
jgi:uncharacterized protein (DUF924 family)